MNNAGYYRFARPYEGIEGVRAFFVQQPGFMQMLMGPASMSAIDDSTKAELSQLHPDIRFALSQTLQTLYNDGVKADLQLIRPSAGDVLADSKLAFRVVGKTAEDNQAITAAMQAAQFVAGRSAGRFQSNPDHEAPAIAAMPVLRDKRGNEWRVIPGGVLWEKSAGSDPERIGQHIYEVFGNQNTPGTPLRLEFLPEVSAPASAPAPSDSPADTPSDTPAPADRQATAPTPQASDAAPPATTPPAAAAPYGSQPRSEGLKAKPAEAETPEQRLDRHTENGLRVLGVVADGASEEERKAKLSAYKKEAGLPENATAAQLVDQVRKDVMAVQTALRDASQQEATKGIYNLGPYGEARDGVDGIAGPMTNGAVAEYIKRNPQASVLALARATPKGQQAAEEYLSTELQQRYAPRVMAELQTVRQTLAPHAVRADGSTLLPEGMATALRAQGLKPQVAEIA